MRETLDTETKRPYLCESCGKTEELTEVEAFDAGWDYPPFIGMWAVVSPRTCGDCGIETTAYWQLITGTPVRDLSAAHVATIKRITEERGYAQADVG